MKEVVRDLDDLKERIHNEVVTTEKKTLEKVLENFKKRSHSVKGNDKYCTKVIFWYFKFSFLPHICHFSPSIGFWKGGLAA